MCSADCKNCGNQTVDCRCKCGTGWTGIDCSGRWLSLLSIGFQPRSCLLLIKPFQTFIKFYAVRLLTNNRSDAYKTVICYCVYNTAVCDDTHVYCNNGWYAGWCEPAYPYVLHNCPKMCGLCGKPVDWHMIHTNVAVHSSVESFAWLTCVSAGSGYPDNSPVKMFVSHWIIHSRVHFGKGS